MCFNRLFRRQYQGWNIFPHNIQNTGRQCVILEFSFYACCQELGSQPQLILVILLCCPNIHVFHEILFFRCCKLQTIYIDFSDHFIHRSTCKISFQLQGEFCVRILGSKIQIIAPYCKKIKSRNLGSDINISIQINGTIRVIQCDLTIKSASFIFAIQRYILISISAIIYRSNQSF